MSKLYNIFQTLSINEQNGLYYTKNAEWKSVLQLPSRVERCLGQVNPDAFFCFDNKPLILFFENPQTEHLHKEIWNINEVPIIIIANNNSVEIFNGFNLLENEEKLEKLGGDEKLTDFSYFQLVTGKTWEIHQEALNHKNRVDYKLLENIRVARAKILEQFPRTNNNNEESEKQYTKITNALLGKIIFVRYLIDKKVELNFEDHAKIWGNDDLCELLKKPNKVVEFFKYLADREKGFNGDLFPITSNEYDIIPNEAYKILIKLLKSEEIATGQKSLFDLYDFSIIPIEFISNIYEYFIGADNQSMQSAYYTPLFLVDYILSETIEKYISENQTYRCKILDPSCGSGVFLVETLRKLIEQYRLNPANDIEQYKEDIKNIAIANIFGVDKDESAVQVAIFSIYLTLLDYMQPREIKSFRFPNLMGTNFFDKDFFDEKADFNNILRNNDFAFIVGNPPWFRVKNEKKKTKQEPLYVQYINNRKKREKQSEYVIGIANKEIAQAFLLRSSDFSSANTKCALIVTSKVLYNLQSKNFRTYFLHNYFIERVFELAPVRREVFNASNDEAIAPACVLFFNFAKNQKTDKNLIEHIALKPSRFFSMFKIFSVYRHDIQTVQQDRLKEYDWLWKVLVYGSYLDFNFIKRLKEDYPTIRQTIDKNGNFIVGQGIMVGGGDKNDVSYLIGEPFINTKTDIRQFWINPDNQKKWKYNIVHRPRNKELFKAPMLLISGGNNKELKCISAVNQRDVIFKSSLTAIKLDNIDLLRQIAGVLNSSFFSYFNIQVFSSTCIEREETHDEEKLDIPFPKTTKISNIVGDLEKLLIQKIQITLEQPNNQQAITTKYIELDNSIYNAFSVSKEEKSLLDYANSVVIPIQMRHKNYEKLFLPLKLNDTILADYANLFIERFTSNFEKIGKKFIVEIWHTKQIIGMFFKVVSQSEYNTPINWKDKQDTTDVFKKIIELGTTKITDQLFVQKDIRGFEKEYFYIFKPNEKRLWHKAVGYLDVAEFEDAILRSGRDKR